MPWNTRWTGGSGVTTWVTGNQPSAAEFNHIGDDIRTWGGNVDADSNDLVNLGDLHMVATKKLGIGTATPGAPLHIIAAPDNNVGHLKLEATASGNSAGVSMYTGGGSTMRNWLIQSNYGSAGGLSFIKSTTNLNAPTVNVMEIYDNGSVAMPLMPSSNPGAASLKLWYDPADGNRVKFAA